MKPLVRTFIGLGSNIGNRSYHLSRAVAAIRCLQHTTLISVSSIYETPPIGFVKQRFFYNAVCLIFTSLSANTLMISLKQIEKEMGRKDLVKRWSPRKIDLDILLYGDEQITQHNLSIPHPELQNRKFALIPLLDIDDPVHPKLRKRISQLIATTKDQSTITRLKDELQPTIFGKDLQVGIDPHLEL